MLSVMLFVFLVRAASLLVSIPATLSLPSGVRRGVKKYTISDAALDLKNTSIKGWPLVKLATLLVHSRMTYCRRNSFDHYEKAFERGYGYCQQSAFALKSLLNKLGFLARVVQSFHNQFPNGTIGSHAWVEVAFNNERKYVDAVFTDEDGNPTFTILGKVYPYTELFRIFAGFWSIPINAIRFYKEGKDSDF
jgi:hypothetical protein